MAISNAATNVLGALLPEWHPLLQEWSASGRLTAAAQDVRCQLRRRARLSNCRRASNQLMPLPMGTPAVHRCWSTGHSLPISLPVLARPLKRPPEWQPRSDTFLKVTRRTA